MKYLLYFVFAFFLFGVFAPNSALAQSATNILCGGETISVTGFDRTWVDASKKSFLLAQCLEHIKTNNKTGARLRVQELNPQTSQPLSPGFDYSSNFCWCANVATPGACTVAPLFGANNSEECNNHCRSANTVSRRFEATYKDYQGTSNNNRCGNYCWCMEPTAATGTETRCTLHRTTRRDIGGTLVSVPLVSNAECNALCPTLRAGERVGSTKHYETTFRDYSNSPDCSTAGPAAATPEAGGSVTPRTSTPAPTVRLFNPLAGASTIVDIINRIINMIMGTVGAGALLMFIYGGITWMTAGGDAKKVTDAQMILKNSTLGILLLMFSYTIIATFFSILR